MVFSILFALPLVAHVTFAATSSYPTKPPFSTIQPALTDIRAAQATVMPVSPISNVQGKAFNRIVQIWLENTVGQVCLIYCSQMLIVEFRTTTRLRLTQTCSGYKAKAFFLQITGL
jgi:hypothetical protein